MTYEEKAERLGTRGTSLGASPARYVSQLWEHFDPTPRGTPLGSKTMLPRSKELFLGHPRPVRLSFTY